MTKCLTSRPTSFARSVNYRNQTERIIFVVFLPTKKMVELYNFFLLSPLKA